MTGGDVFLLALGPTLALAAGLLIYGFGVYGPDHRRSPRETADHEHGPGRP